MGSAGTVAILVQARDFFYKDRIELNHSILYYHLQFFVAAIKHSSLQRQTPFTHSYPFFLYCMDYTPAQRKGGPRWH